MKTRSDDMLIRRGDVFYADLGTPRSHEQGGVRPVLIIQNDIGNRYSPTVIVAPLTSNTDKTPLPTHCHIHVGDKDEGLKKKSLVLMEQIRTIDKDRLIGSSIGKLTACQMQDVDTALSISIGLHSNVR